MYIHLVFHISNNFVTIRPDNSTRLYSYISGILKEKDCFPVRIGGMPDHVHILFVLSFSTSVTAYQRVIRYIDNQPLHHQKKSFKEEYLEILRKSGIEYNEDFLWND